ncbi:MAG TPA: GreA/GreB family elongation factor [Exilispira sp.]|nr:GreA/GreB family elongation factor [Exilispira sp.]
MSCDVVSIGTRCVLLEKESQKKYVYTILGKWDIDINNNIISYETELGKILLNKKVGDEFVNPVDEKIYSILSIEKASN